MYIYVVHFEKSDNPSPNPTGTSQPPTKEVGGYSGFIILRLSRHLQPSKAETLGELVQELSLYTLANLLERYKLDRTERLIRSISPEEIFELESQAQNSEFPPINSLTQYWRIDVRSSFDQLDAIVEALRGAPIAEVEWAYKELVVSETTVNTTSDPFGSNQGYLDNAPTGLGVRSAWLQGNCEGVGVGFVDLEQTWNLTHEDLKDQHPAKIYGDIANNAPNSDHGTQVLGIVAARNNSTGVVGIAPNLGSVRVTSHYRAGDNTALHVADAIGAAIPVMSVGDVLLLEVQREQPAGNKFPTEIDDGDFDAIRLASAVGIIVVEAAGNGHPKTPGSLESIGNDLDAYINAAGVHTLDRTLTGQFRDSGAIMVGAAEPRDSLPNVTPVKHKRDRLESSNYGSRVDCYAWGDGIYTCGGNGDATPTQSNPDLKYTGSFSKTSGASAIIAGAAVLLQGKYFSVTGTRLSPGQMRFHLGNRAAGTVQGLGVYGNIGPMPNLMSILSNLNVIADVYLRDNLGDHGQVPSTGILSASPDIIVRNVQVANPTLAFGQGSGTENSMNLSDEVIAGQNNFVYIRMKNRGSTTANTVRARVFWSVPATLVTPNMWHLIGEAIAPSVPQGNTLVVTNPLTWPAADIPAPGHYCFVAILDHLQDPAPPLPSSFDIFHNGLSMNNFVNLVKNQNNVGWRNFNVITISPGPGNPPPLPFYIAGAPDEWHHFDLEILQYLPEKAQVWLEIPIGLAPQFRVGRFWNAKSTRKQVKFLLPARPEIRIPNVSLPPEELYASRFIVNLPRDAKPDGASIAMRQLYNGLEVGRITFQFQQSSKNEED